MRVAMIAPQREQCGVADYTTYLVQKLEPLVERVTRIDAARYDPSIHSADIVHIQHQYFLFGGVAPWKCTFRQLARRLSAPVVMTVHEFVEPHGSLLRRMAVRLSNRLHFRHHAIRRFIVHTAQDRSRLVASGLPSDRIEVVRHGVPDSPTLPPADVAKRSLNLEGRFVISVLGFLSRRKGHSLALEALTHLPPTVMLVFAGGRHPDDASSYMDDLITEAAQQSVRDRLRITGYLQEDEMAETLAASDVILAPFIESSGSGSLALAFAAGKPIVASDIPPHQEIIQELPGAMILFPVGSSNVLARIIRSLMDSADSLADGAIRSRKYAETHSYSRMAQETLQAYNDVLALSTP